MEQYFRKALENSSLSSPFQERESVSLIHGSFHQVDDFLLLDFVPAVSLVSY